MLFLEKKLLVRAQDDEEELEEDVDDVEGENEEGLEEEDEYGEGSDEYLKNHEADDGEEDEKF